MKKNNTLENIFIFVIAALALWLLVLVIFRDEECDKPLPIPIVTSPTEGELIAISKDPDFFKRRVYVEWIFEGNPKRKYNYNVKCSYTSDVGGGSCTKVPGEERAFIVTPYEGTYHLNVYSEKYDKEGNIMETVSAIPETVNFSVKFSEA